jgi:CRP-like cAMP-binding protein
MNLNAIQALGQHFGLEPNIINEFFSYMAYKKFKKRELIIKQGEVSQYLYFITKGICKSFTRDKNGIQQILYFAMENYWVSDIYSFHTGNGSTTTVEALEDCEVLMISREDLNQVYEKHHSIESHFRKLLEKRSAKLLYDRFKLISLNALERYDDFMENEGKLASRLLQKDIASYLGIFPESLSRIRKSKSKPKN